MKKVAALFNQVRSQSTIFFDGYLILKKLIPECQAMGFFAFGLPALVSNKIRLQPLDEEAVPRGGRVI